MTKEDKELLFVDLSARLAYGVKCYPVITNGEPNTIGGYCETLDDFYIREVDGWFNISMIKPYLRPLSSMTEEEFNKLKEYSGLIYDQLDLASFQDGAYKCLDFYLNEVPADVVIMVFDWLNRNHFDYRNLIVRGLALDCTDLNVY